MDELKLAHDSYCVKLTATECLIWPSVCCLGDYDRAARVLFVQHPREQGEWLRQNPFALLLRVLDEQHPSRPVIIPIITRNSQIRDICTEIRTA